jgi:MFS family permease
LSKESNKAKVLLILCVAQFATMLIWYNFAAVLPAAKEAWCLTNDQAGTILGAFQFGYVAAVFFAGWLTDRVGGRLIFALSAAAAGMAGLSFVFFAHDYSSALIWRTLAGFGLGGLYVPGMLMLCRWYPGYERGRAIGIYTCSTVLSYAGAYLVASPLASLFSWQTAMLFTSVWAFPAAALVWFMVPEPPSQAMSIHRESTDGPSMGANRAFWLIIGGYAGHMWELYAFWGWIGAFFSYALTLKGADANSALAYGGVIAAACTAMGGISPGLAGWLSDRSGRCITTSVAMLVSGTCALVFGWLASAPIWLFSIVGLIYGFFIVADSAVFKAGLTELVPEHGLGLALGIQSAIGYSMTVLTPKLFGAILDTYGWGFAFTSLAVGPLVGAACMLVLRRLPEAKAMAGGRR